jgi:hypothetical protein
MTKCNYCGKEQNENAFLQVGENAFCNNLCKHSFEKNGSNAMDAVFPAKSKPQKDPKKSRMTAIIFGVFIAAIVATVAVQLTKGSVLKDSSGLKKFNSPDKSFSVMLPKDVKEDKQTAFTELGPIEFISYSAKAEFQEFTIAYSDYPDTFVVATGPNVLLDGSRDGAVRNVQGKLLSETKIEINGYPGRELKIESPQKIILKSQIYMVGKRLYQLMAISNSDHSLDKEIDEVKSDRLKREDNRRHARRACTFN